MPVRETNSKDDEANGVRHSGLLSRLHRFYRPGRQSYDKEDLFTEYLAWLLNRSREFRIGFAELALEESAEMSPELFGDAKARTQVDTGGSGWIDLVLDVSSEAAGQAGDGDPEIAVRLGIECKIDSKLGDEQLDRYHEWLDEEAARCEYVALAALTPKRLGQGRMFAGEEPPYWHGRLFWHEVQQVLERCVQEVQAERLPALDPEEDDFLASAGFVVIGDEFRDLMTEEGMLAATKIEPLGDAALFRDYKRYKDRRVDEILSLIENALDTAGVEAMLREEAGADDLRTEHKKNRAKGRPAAVIHHRDDPPAAFMFGVTVSPPNKYARRPGETVNEDSHEAELIAGYKLLAPSRGVLQWRWDLEGIAESLTDAARDLPGCDVEVFVPENASYQKLVARRPVPTAEDADEQAERMGQFYRTFVLAFLTSEGPDGQSMLVHLHARHREAAVGE